MENNSKIFHYQMASNPSEECWTQSHRNDSPRSHQQYHRPTSSTAIDKLVNNPDLARVGLVQNLRKMGMLGRYEKS